PLLYCDQQGNRVGYGKGYYDGFFETVNVETLKIGISFFGPDEEIDDLRENDIPLDYLVTPAEVLSFLGAASKSTK
ncbi:5-formyltetrahydrofolate cyclo-ligase, partial [Kaistella sp.]|uniref:5-formyltetrahydrofolate cyclo-ligase n=1 Tax=Kaistella sp. TaxID=2782235 RepID=UPI002F92F70B